MISSLVASQYTYDEEAAQRAVDFFRLYLRHIKGQWANQPLTLLPWQEHDVIRPMFGWKRADGTRKYRTAYIEVPRKQGKSTLSAGIALYLLFADQEPGAEIYSAASDRDQAAIVFELARDMVDRNPSLTKRSETYRRSVVVPSTASSYKVLSAESYTKHGINAHGIIFDELHAQTNRDLWDVLTTSTGARRQPLIVTITTAGWDRNSVCWEQHEYAEKVRDGIIDDPAFLPVIYNAGILDWRTPEAWAKANPSLGVTVKRDFLEAECRRAQDVPGYQNTFRRLYLNEWTTSEQRWLDMATWNACGEAVDGAALEGRACFAGLDLSSTLDITALVLAFPDHGGGYDVLPYFWVPTDNAQKRADRDRVPYPLWVENGHIEATEGNVVDYDVIRKRINELKERFDIREIAIDRWNSTQLQTQLMGDGFTVVPFGQGFASMTAPTKELEKLVVAKAIRHGGNPVLRWMASNVAVQQDAAGNLKPAKDKSSERIDGIVALIMALGRAIAHGDGGDWSWGST